MLEEQGGWNLRTMIHISDGPMTIERRGEVSKSAFITHIFLYLHLSNKLISFLLLLFLFIVRLVFLPRMVSRL